jgi:DNA-binding NtrC family response regulator
MIPGDGARKFRFKRDRCSVEPSVIQLFGNSRPDIRVIIITAYGTVGLAVEATRLGAVDFVQKLLFLKKSEKS